MLTALLIWGLALYGAWMLITQCVRHIEHRQVYEAQPATYIFIVKNAEKSIEGILRLGMIHTVFHVRQRRMVVLDVNSDDQTSNIVQRLMAEHPCISYRYISSAQALVDILPEVCLNANRLCYVYDLRNHEALTAARRGRVWKIHEDSSEKKELEF
jgi:hypothetical protein